MYSKVYEKIMILHIYLLLAKYYEKNVMFEDDYKFNMLASLN